MHIKFEIENNWASAQEPLHSSVLLSLHESEEALLLSGASMTEHLEELLGAPIEVETRLGKTVHLNSEDAAFLEISPNTKTVEREVWLTIKGKKLIYAHTLMPLVSIEVNLLNSLKERITEPIGRVLRSLDIPFLKKKLTIALLTSEPLAAELGLDSKTRFAARRYILYTDTAANNTQNRVPEFKAAVMEIFTPDIIACKA